MIATRTGIGWLTVSSSATIAQLHGHAGGLRDSPRSLSGKGQGAAVFSGLLEAREQADRRADGFDVGVARRSLETGIRDVDQLQRGDEVLARAQPVQRGGPSDGEVVEPRAARRR